MPRALALEALDDYLLNEPTCSAQYEPVFHSDLFVRNRVEYSDDRNPTDSQDVSLRLIPQRAEAHHSDFALGNSLLEIEMRFKDPIGTTVPNPGGMRHEARRIRVVVGNLFAEEGRGNFVTAFPRLDYEIPREPGQEIIDLFRYGSGT